VDNFGKIVENLRVHVHWSSNFVDVQLGRGRDCRNVDNFAACRAFRA